MKKKIIKTVKVVLAVFLIVACLGEVGIYARVMRNKDIINEYLDEYNTGTATFDDVKAVNLHLKDYVKIGETETSDLVLSRSYWFFGITLMSGYKKSKRFGNIFTYRDKNNNSYSVTATDEWCPFFRVYSVSKGIIRN